MIKIIAPKISHNIISKQLLKDKNVLGNIQILPLEAFINTLVPIDESTYNEDLVSRLGGLKGTLSVLDYYLDNEDFIKSIKDFHIDMHLYRIKLSDLKSETSKDKDLKVIFSAIFDLIPPQINTLNKLKNTVNRESFKDVYLSKQPLYSNYKKEVVNLFEKFGLKSFDEIVYPVNKVKLYYTNNMRSEVEASAQMILEQSSENTTVIVLNNDYIPLVKQVYDRYNLDFMIINDSKNNSLFIQFIKTIKLLEDKSSDSVKEFLSANPLDLDNIISLISLNKLFEFDLTSLINYTCTSLEDSIVHKSSLEHYQDIAEKSLVSIELITNFYNNTQNYKDNLSLLEYVFNLFLDKKDNISDLRILRQTIINNKSELRITDCLWESLENLLLKSNKSSKDSSKIMVTTINNHFYHNKDFVIILGASANNFIKISQKSGVIDEKYVRDLTYPTKASRFSEQVSFQENILNAKNISIFYPLSDYSGKGIEPSFNLINFAKKHKAIAKRYPLVENDNSEHKTYILNKNIAKRLFFKDEMLEGSISAFEQYNSCNYSYFLKHGLKLYTKELPDLSYAYIGSIIHEVMEAVTNRQIKNLPILDKNEVETIVYELMDPIEALNPGDSKTQIVKRLLIRQINDVLEHMRSIESDTKFQPIMAEQKFTYTINNNIRLYGFVDRVDSYLNNIRVIDFKSSKQNLSEKEFKQGLQLQLITYLMAISEFYKQRPAGAFYHPMRLDNTNVVAGTAKKTKEMFYPLTKEEVEANFLSNNRLAGWHFNDEADTFYSSQNYVAGLNEGKTGLSVRGKAKNFETVATILEAIYKDIYNNLNEGIIDCVPIDNPCQYCDYHSICLSKTTSNFKELIYKDQKISEEINNEVD